MSLFTLADRANRIKELYGLRPKLAQDLISMIYPYEINQSQYSGLAKAAAEVMGNEYLLNRYPDVEAALKAYQKAQKEAIKAQHDVATFPALHATQPAIWRAQHG